MRVSLVAVMVLIGAYLCAVGFLLVRETSLVFVGAGETPWGIWVPKRADVPWDTLRSTADDGALVFLMESRVDDAQDRPWAIYFHGNSGILGTRSNVGRYRLLREAGFNVLAVEYRGYGASAGNGKPSETGLYTDARAAWHHLVRDRKVAPTRIVVYGWSLGSGPAMYLATEMKPAAVITEGAFTSLPDIGASRYPWIPARLLMRNRFDNLARAPSITVPWILFHSTNDDKVPFSHAERLAAAGRDERFIPLAARHGDGVLATQTIALPALRELAQRLNGTDDKSS
jgi:fermentation-respiration switch protein FrsA (DUF1100 family)